MLAISVDPSLADVVHLVLKVLGALDVVNQVMHVVGGGDGSLHSQLLHCVATGLQGKLLDAMVLLLLVELPQGKPLTLNLILALKHLGLKIVVAKLSLPNFVLEVGDLLPK